MVKLLQPKLKVLSTDKQKQTAIVEITIHEGRNRQVRQDV